MLRDVPGMAMPLECLQDSATIIAHEVEASRD
jgi:hypothetical protein